MKAYCYKMFCDNALMEKASRVFTKLNAKRWAPLDELDLLVVEAFNNFFVLYGSMNIV